MKMSTEFSRRAVIRGIGQSAAVGSLAVVLPRMLSAAEAAVSAAPAATTPAVVAAAPAYCLTMLYPSGKDASGKELSFDAGAFRDRHLLTLKGAYGDSVERVELRMPPPPPPPAPPVEGAAPPTSPPTPPPTPPLLAAVSMWIRDTAAFSENMKTHQKEVAADMADITASQPFGQLDRVVRGFGKERGDVVLESSCLSYYFRIRELKDKVPATWDVNGYVENYLPKLYEAFGAEAIDRIEVVQGEPRGGKLSMLGAVHFYIGDEQKFVAAADSEVVKLLAPEEAKYANAPPLQTFMLVRAAG
jgi:hypothetical protein